MPGSAAQTPTTPPGDNAQTPTSPGDGQTPTSPASEPEAAAAPPPPPTPTLTIEGIQRITEGMSYDEIQKELGAPGVLVAGNQDSSEVFRWSDAGVSFMGRFEKGKLTRKSMLKDGVPVRTDADEKRPIDTAIYDAILEGMTFDQVMAIIGMDAQPLTKSGTEVAIYKWTDDQGSSFTARFENGVLKRKNGLYVAPAPHAAESPATGDADAVQAPEENDAEPEGDLPTPPGPREKSGATTEDPDTSQSGQSLEKGRGKVAVAGATRRQRELDSDDPNARRSYRPRAELPRVSRRLRSGSYEIRVGNYAESGVKAALLSEEGGMNLRINAGGETSVRVDQGNYVLYFIYDDDPYTLNRGGAIPISQWRTDMQIFLVGESYDVQVLDRSQDQGRTSRRR